MIVELVGAPGAGKTSLVPTVVHALESSGRPVLVASEAIDRELERTAIGNFVLRLLGGRRRRARLLLVDVPGTLAFVVRHPRLMLVAGSAILRAPVGPGHRSTLFFRWAGVAARQRFLAALSERAILVVDEGFYHRAINLFAWRALDTRPHGTAWWRRPLERYLGLVPAPEIAVFVNVPTPIAMDRVRARGMPVRLRGRSDAEASAFLERAAEVARLIPRLAATRSEWHHIDNSTSLDAASAEIRRSLSSSPALSRASRDDRWPSAPSDVSLRLPRPDRWWRTRARRLAGQDQERLIAACRALGLTARGPARSVGSGRSWSVIVDTDQGPALVKRYKPTVEEAAIVTEHGVLTALAESEIGVPRLMPSGGRPTLATLPDGRYAAFRYEPGLAPAHSLLLSRAVRRHLTERAGTALASLHAALATVEPAARPSTGLNAEGGRAVPSAWHAERLARVPRTGETLRARLCELDADLTDARLSTTIIHGDFGPYNVLVGSGRPLLVVDFELSRVDWCLVDLSTAVPRFAESRAGFSGDRLNAFLAGYRAASQISYGELILLPAVLEFLSLRRAAVCLDRWTDTGDPRAATEARARIALARRLADGRHPLAAAMKKVDA